MFEHIDYLTKIVIILIGTFSFSILLLFSIYLIYFRKRIVLRLNRKEFYIKHLIYFALYLTSIEITYQIIKYYFRIKIK